jgi:hypothetical protein
MTCILRRVKNNNITNGSVIKLNLSTLAVTNVTPSKPAGAQGAVVRRAKATENSGKHPDYRQKNYFPYRDRQLG